jgi:hypothetical protein
VKVTYELPPELVSRLNARVPRGQRSGFVKESIEKRLGRENILVSAAAKANKLSRVNREMKDWEALNGTED